MAQAPRSGPVTVLHYVITSVSGALHLIIDGPPALSRFDLSVAGFWRSFGAALVSLPIYGLVLATSGRGLDGHALTGALVIYGLNWVTFPIVMLAVSKLLGLSDNYVRYIIVYNWARVVIALVQAPLPLLAASDVLSAGLFVVIATVVTATVLVYQWRIARISLGAAWPAAVAVVVLDVVLGDVIAAAGRAVLGGGALAPPVLVQ